MLRVYVKKTEVHLHRENSILWQDSLEDVETKTLVIHRSAIFLQGKIKEKAPVFSTKCLSALSRHLEGDRQNANLRKVSSFIGVNGPRIFGRDIDVAKVLCFIDVLEPRFAKHMVFIDELVPISCRRALDAGVACLPIGFA